MSSSGASCCTLFPTDSIVSVTTVSSPTAAVPPSSPNVVFCWRHPRRRLRRRLTIANATVASQAAPSISVRAAAAPWSRLARCRAGPKPGQTPHDPPRIASLAQFIPASAPVAAGYPRSTRQHRASAIDSNASPGLQRPNGAVFRVSDDPATPLLRALQPYGPVRSPRLGHTAKSQIPIARSPSRGSVQSGFKEVATHAPPYQSRPRPLRNLLIPRDGGHLESDRRLI